MATKKAVKKAIKKALKKSPVKKAAAKKTAPKKSVKKSAVKKSAPRKSNLERLTAADVIAKENVGDHDPAVIKKLSASEVSALIKIRKKLGAAPAGGGGGTSRPNFPV